jgi:hypothetical protein
MLPPRELGANLIPLTRFTLWTGVHFHFPDRLVLRLLFVANRPKSGHGIAHWITTKWPHTTQRPLAMRPRKLNPVVTHHRREIDILQSPFDGPKMPLVNRRGIA